MAATEIIGSVGVRVRPELSGFRRELISGLKKIQVDFEIPVRANTATAAAEMMAFRRNQERQEIEQRVSLSRRWLRSAVSDFAALGSAATRFIGSIAKISLGLSAVVGVFNVVGSAAAVLVSASGVLAGVPAILGATAIAAGAVILGLEGIKDAFKSNQQALNNLKTSVADTFRKELQPAVKDINNILPQLRTGFQEIAKSMSGIANSVTRAFATSGVRAFNSLIGPTSTLLSNIGAAIGPVLVGLLNMAGIGARVFAPMTSGAEGAARAFQSFTESAEGIQKIEGWIRGGIDALKQIGSVLSDVGRIFSSVFKAFREAGVGLGETFGTAVSSIADFFESLEGQTVLKSVAQALSSLATTVGTFLGPALKAIAPLIPPLLAIFTTLASQISAVLLPAIQTLAPILTTILTFLSENMEWIGPTVLVIVGAFLAWKIAALALNAVLALNPFVLIAAAIVAALFFIITHWDQVKEAFRVGWEFIKNVFETAWNAIVNVVNTGIDWVVNLVRDAWNSIRDTAVDIWNSITNALRTAWNNAKQAAADIWNGVKQFFGDTWNNIRQGAVDGFNKVVDFVKSIPQKIKDALGDLGRLLLEAGKAVITGLLNGIKEAAQKVFDFVSTIAGKIASLKGPLPYDRVLLIPAGNAIMAGLVKGLAEGSKDVYGFVSGVGDDIAKTLNSTIAGKYSAGSLAATVDDSRVVIEAGDSLYNQVLAAIEGWAINFDSRGVAYKTKTGDTLNGLR